jgi:hypothetical protein
MTSKDREVVEHIISTLTTLFIPMVEQLAEGAKDQAELLIELVPIIMELINIENPLDRLAFGLVIMNKIGEIARIGHQQMDRSSQMVEDHIADWKANFPEFASEGSS